MPKKHAKLRRAVIDTCLDMNARGINQGTSGNVSVRVPDGFLITASGIDYENMTPDQVVQMDLDAGYTGDWMPSSEWRMHMDIYRERAEAGAIVHTHSAHATALSCLRADIPPFHYMIGVTGAASLKCASYATFGTEALSKAMLRAMVGSRACLLANHGMICFGKDLKQALKLAVEIEALCRQYMLACQMGTPEILSKAEMKRILDRFAAYGKQADELPPNSPMAKDAAIRRG